MNDEKLRIMQMVKDGTISPEEGIDLIEALGASKMVEKEDTGEAIMQAEPVDEISSDSNWRPHSIHRHHREHREKRHAGRGKAKWLYIQVNEGDGKNVNIRIPLTLAKFAGKFIPNEAKKELKDKGIELDLDGILNTLQEEGEMNLVEVDEGDDKTVRIFTK